MVSSSYNQDFFLSKVEEEENPEEECEDEERDESDEALKKAFKKWQDHRPSFAEMHAEDVKRRPR